MNQMLAEGAGQTDVVLARTADVRYFGQGYELEISVPGGKLGAEELRLVCASFGEAHRRQYGYVKEANEAIELVNLRVTAVGLLPKPRFHPQPDSPVAAVNPDRACKGRRAVYFRGDFVDTPIFERSQLQVSDSVAGPAIIEQLDSTTVLPPGLQASVDPYSNLVIRAHESH
jgi:N-methylhydantoinase A